MKVKLSIGCTAEESDKERVVRLFKENNISLAGYVWKCLLKKAEELEGEK